MKLNLIHKLLVLILVSLIASNALAQQIVSRLKFDDYYTVGPKRAIERMKISNDSLFISYSAPYNKTDRYKIVGGEKRGTYSLLYTKIPGSKFFPVKHPYSVFVFSYSADKRKLFVLHEDKLFYDSLSQAQNANIGKTFADKYFNTWYTEDNFNIYSHYPDINNADKNAIQKVVEEWKAEFYADKEKMEKVQNLNPTAFTAELLIKALIKEQLSPVAEVREFFQKLTSYHINYPVIRQDIKGNLVLHFNSVYTWPPEVEIPKEKVMLNDTTICAKVYSCEYDTGSRFTTLHIKSSSLSAKYIIRIGWRDRGKFKIPPEVAFKDKTICVTGKISGQNQIWINDPIKISIK